GDLRSTLARKHQPPRSRPLNRLRKPGSGCQSSAWTTVVNESRSATRAVSASGVFMDVVLKINGLGGRLVTFRREWPRADAGPSDLGHTFTPEQGDNAAKQVRTSSDLLRSDRRGVKKDAQASHSQGGDVARRGGHGPDVGRVSPFGVRPQDLA